MKQYKDLKIGVPNKVALSFSGGGYRAATFSLGCLSYMENVMVKDRKLTENIDFISSASGGSITNLSYTLSQRQSEDFKFITFYKDLSKKLEGTYILDRAMTIMQDDAIWKKRPDKPKNIINAFSIAYDEILFKESTFGIYHTNKQESYVKEVCVNSTEFDNALSFRFQNGALSGNWYLHFTDSYFGWNETLNKIKLGDILAASSCFPIGFEPIMFPNDFTHADLTSKELKSSITTDPIYSQAIGNQSSDNNIEFGLMDGGIDDNQAIGCYMNAEKRLQKDNKFGYDLFISCDVTSNFTKQYEYPEENRKSLAQKLSVMNYIQLTLLLFVLSIFCITQDFLVSIAHYTLGVSSLLTLFIIAIFILGLKTNRKPIKDKSTYVIAVFKYLKIFLHIKLSALLQMLDSRGRSAIHLTSFAFLKKIRRLSYSILYQTISEINNDDEVLLKHLGDFSIQNSIYFLARKNDKQRIKEMRESDYENNIVTIDENGNSITIKKLLDPSVQIQDATDYAANMETTLWFDAKHVDANAKNILIATGQFTTCHNLLRFAFKNGKDSSFWNEIQKPLIQDWLRFQEDPFWRYKELEK